MGLTPLLLFNLALALCPLAVWGAVLDILSYGAVPNDASNQACYANSHAIEKALNAANASGETVLVPGEMTFHVFTSQVSFLHNVTFRVDGTLVISNNITEWTNEIRDFTAALNFLECRGLTLLGSGVVDGQGYEWWWTAIEHKFNYHRPHMLWVYGSEDVEVHDLHFLNSPNFHCRIYDVHRLHIRNISIHVDVTAQQSMLERFGHWLDYKTTSHGFPAGFPTFPLNTDGIDVNGHEVLIEDSTIQNFDDAVVVKPLPAPGAGCDNLNASHGGRAMPRTFTRTAAGGAAPIGNSRSPRFMSTVHAG
jgi:polygalacturonase